MRHKTNRPCSPETPPTTTPALVLLSPPQVRRPRSSYSLPYLMPLLEPNHMDVRSLRHPGSCPLARLANTSPSLHTPLISALPWSSCKPATATPRAFTIESPKNFGAYIFDVVSPPRSSLPAQATHLLYKQFICPRRFTSFLPPSRPRTLIH
jgi:hypothetical protein